MTDSFPRWLYVVAIIPPFLGLVFLYIYATTAGDWASTAQAVAIFYFQAAAAFATGAILGLLFGVPRLSSSPSTAENTAVRIIHNGNLAEISDWLTKLLIGISITQFYPFLKLLNHYAIGIALSLTLRGSPAGEAPVILANFLSYTAWGFLNAYLASRLFLPRLLKDYDPNSTS